MKMKILEIIAFLIILPISLIYLIMKYIHKISGFVMRSIENYDPWL